MDRLALALAAALAGCAGPPPEVAPAVAAPVVVAPVTVAESLLPRVHDIGCQLDDRPAHRLVLTANGLALDGVALPAVHPWLSVLERPELTLAVDSRLFYSAVRPLLAALQRVPGLRLWVSLSVGDERQVRHLPIDLPRFGAPRPTILPPSDFTHHIDGLYEYIDESDPLGIRLYEDSWVEVDHILVSASDETLWESVTRGLADTCAGATLVDPPTIQAPLPRLTYSVGAPTVPGDLDPDEVDRAFSYNKRLGLCFQRALARGLPVRGRIEITFTVDETGLITSAVIDPATPRDAELDACVIVAALQRLPRSGDGRELTVRVPFYMYPLDKDRPGRRFPRVTQGKATVKGPLDRDIIKVVVRRYHHEVQLCYDQASDAKAGGDVTLRLVIGGDGKVTTSKVQAARFSDEQVIACIAAAAGRWVFPAPGRRVTADVPLTLARGD